MRREREAGGHILFIPPVKIKFAGYVSECILKSGLMASIFPNWTSG